jgi:outer membrane protein
MLSGGISTADAADLIQVYEQALISDPIYQQAINQQLSTSEGVPLSISQLLPNVGLNFTPGVTRQAFSGAQVNGTAVAPRNNTQRAFALTLSLSQTIFNYAQFAGVEGALATSKGACATLNAALQSLMTRVSYAYFAVLQDEENLTYAEASKIAYKEQLDQAQQYMDVGLKTVTDVYTARASYDSAVAKYITTKAQLANDRENLRVITGKYYPHLSTLSNNFPLVTPKPALIDAWVDKAQAQNWTIKANQFSVENARAIVKQQYAGHLPTVTLDGTLDRQYQQNINGYPGTIDERKGPNTQTDRGIAINMNLPIFEGGSVVALTNQAIYSYKVAQQQLEQIVRTTLGTTRQSYMNVIAGISQLTADKEAIQSNISSLQGMETSYHVGTETLVNVLNQQQKLFQAQTQYATDRYAFVNNVLALKQAAGTLSFDDLRAINAWLDDTSIAKRPQHIRPVVVMPLTEKKQTAPKMAAKQHVVAKKKFAKNNKHAKTMSRA